MIAEQLTEGNRRWKERFIFIAERTPLNCEPDWDSIGIESRRTLFRGNSHGLDWDIMALKTAWRRGGKWLNEEERLNVFLNRLSLTRRLELQNMRAARARILALSGPSQASSNAGGSRAGLAAPISYSI